MESSLPFHLIVHKDTYYVYLYVSLETSEIIQALGMSFGCAALILYTEAIVKHCDQGPIHNWQPVPAVDFRRSIALFAI